MPNTRMPNVGPNFYCFVFVHFVLSVFLSFVFVDMQFVTCCQVRVEVRPRLMTERIYKHRVRVHGVRVRFGHIRV